MTEHEGRIVVVTGVLRGIGRAVAVHLAREGARVVVHGASRETVDDAVDEIRGAGGTAIGLPGPIESESTARDLVALAISEFGGLDSLVTSAGIQRYGDAVATTPEAWDEVLAVNVRGVFLATHHALPVIRRSDGGSIVIVSSVQATATQAQVVAYTASKGALLALGRALAVDEAAHGVRVNTVSPGSVDTPMLRAAAADFSDGSADGIAATIREWGSAHPLGRVATADEVAEVVGFLVGRRSGFVTGTDVRVDGGLLARLPAALPRDPAEGSRGENG